MCTLKHPRLIRTTATLTIGIFFFLASPSDASRYSRQQEQFIKAENALKHKKTELYQAMVPTLQHYPLYPYLEYNFLTQHLDQAHKEAIQGFLAQYKHTLLADKLRLAFVRELAVQKQWHAIIEHLVDQDKNTAMLCHYLYAQHNLGKHTPTDKDIRDLWLVSYDQPNDCIPLFKHWLSIRVISDSLIWARLNMAMQQANTQLSTYLAHLLSHKLHSMGQWYLQMNTDPLLLIQKKSVFINQPNPYKQDIMTYGLMQMAYKNPSATLKLWETFRNHYRFTAEQEDHILEKLARGFMREKPSELTKLIKMRPSNHTNQVVLESLIRYAISVENWASIRDNIEKFPAKIRAEPIWQYWYARSLDQLGEKNTAMKIFTDLANQRHYYGFLSAATLNQTSAMHHTKLAISPSEYQAIQSDPAIARVQEFILLDRPESAYKEWLYFINKLDDKQQYIAARVAHDHHWSYLALRTAARIKHQDDLELRFPRLFENLIRKTQKHHPLFPELLFAVIRQESLFQPNAVSHAGAKGLMQLMPNTAKDIAKKIKINPMQLRDLHKPALNIQLGSAYLHYLLEKFNSNTVLSIAAYNAGPYRMTQWLPNKPQAADVWIESIPFYETREYVKSVATYMIIYQYLLGKDTSLKIMLQPILKMNHP